MRRALAFVIGSLVLGASPAISGDPNKEDLKLLQGKWKFESRTHDGKSGKGVDLSEMTPVWEVTGDKIVYAGGEVHAVLRLDAGQKPKAFDFDDISKDPAKTKKGMKGIYKIDDDTWTVCVAPMGKERPTAFESKEGSGYVLTVLKRVKDSK